MLCLMISTLMFPDFHIVFFVMVRFLLRKEGFRKGDARLTYLPDDLDVDAR